MGGAFQGRYDGRLSELQSFPKAQKQTISKQKVMN